MHPLLEELVDEYHGEEREVSNDFPIAQENLVMTLNFGAIEPLLVGYCQRNPECRLAMATFPCLMKRSRYPAVTSMAFPGGAVVWVGGKNFPTTLHTALLHYIDLQEYRKQFQPDYPFDKLVFGSPQQANLVFKVEFPEGPYNLADYNARITGVKYEPDQFPGASLVINDEFGSPLATTVAFEFGIVNFMGCKSLLDVRKAIPILYKKLSQFVCVPRECNDNVVPQRVKEREEALVRARNDSKKAKSFVTFENMNEEDFLDDLLNDGNLLDTLIQ